MSEIHIETRADGCVLLHASAQLGGYPMRVTDRLRHWADGAPDRVFLAERQGPHWRRLTYRRAWSDMRAIARALQGRGLSAERPVVILSGNGIDHALLALACLHIGIPYAPISPAYSLPGSDLAKLRQIVAALTPGLVFAAGPAYQRALDAVAPGTAEIVGGVGPGATPLASLLVPCPTRKLAIDLDAAAERVDGDTIAKFLFTSGSTGTPKAVINTHRMLCANQAMIGACLGLPAAEPPVLVDWLPWSHTFGGNHNFNLVLFNGGTLFIDPGRPTPGQFEPTLAALRENAPTHHLTVPKAWDALARHLRDDPALNRHFYSRLRVAFYAGASMPQPLWDELARLSQAATGHIVPMITGLGSTETAPMATASDGTAQRAGHVGLPVPGVQMKLTPVGDKLEARVRGPSITRGYWRDPVATEQAFDEEGYHRTGDAVTWIDPARPEQGLCFDGRLAEDFKLTSGTWVSVGPLRGRLIAAMAPHVRDIVVAGHGRDAIAVLALPHDPAAATNPAVRALVAAALTHLAANATGSATRVTRLAFLADALSIEAGEITDKGSINQAAVLRCRASTVDALYHEPPAPEVMCIATSTW